MTPFLEVSVADRTAFNSTFFQATHSELMETQRNAASKMICLVVSFQANWTDIIIVIFRFLYCQSSDASIAGR